MNTVCHWNTINPCQPERSMLASRAHQTHKIPLKSKQQKKTFLAPFQACWVIAELLFVPKTVCGKLTTRAAPCQNEREREKQRQKQTMRWCSVIIRLVGSLQRAPGKGDEASSNFLPKRRLETLFVAQTRCGGLFSGGFHIHGAKSRTIIKFHHNSPALSLALFVMMESWRCTDMNYRRQLDWNGGINWSAMEPQFVNVVIVCWISRMEKRVSIKGHRNAP